MKRDPSSKPLEYEEAIAFMAKQALSDGMAELDRCGFKEKVDPAVDLVSAIYAVDSVDVVDDITLAIVAMREVTK